MALARALVVEPALILLDEPLGSLDARLRIEMQSELKSLQQQWGSPSSTSPTTRARRGDGRPHRGDERGAVRAGRYPGRHYGSPRTRFVAQFVGTNNISRAVARSEPEGTVRTAAGDWWCGERRCPRRGSDSVSSSAPTACAGWKRPRRRQRTRGGRARDRVHGEPEHDFTARYPAGGVEDGAAREPAAGHRAPKHGETLRAGWDADDGFVLPDT